MKHDKHVVSISLGSSQRDKRTTMRLGNKTILVERIGCDGDEERAKALYAEMDGKVDAFGVGGVELYVRVAEKNYPLRSGINLVKQVRKTPYTDGRGLKLTLEQSVFQQIQPHLDFEVWPRRGLMPMACDRYGMAVSLHRAGFEMLYGDLLFGLGLPIPVRGLARLRALARVLLPVVGLMPISMLYPTGENQDENTPKYERWFNDGSVIAGDFQYIRRYMPLKLTGKIIITNTTTEADVRLMQERELAYLVTTTPRIEGRSFGANVLEAALMAYSGATRELTDSELFALVQDLDLQPQVQALK